MIDRQSIHPLGHMQDMQDMQATTLDSRGVRDPRKLREASVVLWKVGNRMAASMWSENYVSSRSWLELTA